MPVTFDATPQTGLWLPQPSIRAFISDKVASDVRVLLRPRAEAGLWWAQTHPNGSTLPPVPPYAFRAWCNPSKGEIVILVDRTETPESVTWLTLHELTHQELRRSPLIAEALGRVAKPPDYLTSDNAHQSHPEERICDWIATIWYRRLGFAPPWRLDRYWWRRQVRSKVG